MKVVSVGITDVGKKRDHNEDNFLINEELNLYLVADGMGGHVGGERASAIAVNVVEEVVSHLDLDSSTIDAEAWGERFQYAVSLAGRRIFETAVEDQTFTGMGTTLVGLLIRNGKGYIAHVGDSRGYLLRGDVLEQRTEDHSLVNEKVKAGLITAEEALTHRLRNVITRSLGFQDEVDVDLSITELKAGDLFLLCSDGLSGLVSNDEIGEILRTCNIQEASRQMVELACDRGGDDNITVVTAQVKGA